MKTGPQRFAARTSVPFEKTQAAVTKLLGSFEASAIAVGVEYSYPPKAHVFFEIKGRRVRIEAPLVPPKDSRTKPGQQERVVWRMMLLLIRAKLEAVESGATTIDREFLADVVTSGGKTIGQLLAAGTIATRGETPIGLLQSGTPGVPS